MVAPTTKNHRYWTQGRPHELLQSLRSVPDAEQATRMREVAKVLGVSYGSVRHAHRLSLHPRRRGRKPPPDASAKQALVSKVRAGESIKDAAEAVGISKTAVYRDRALVEEIEKARNAGGTVPSIASPSYDLVPFTRGMYLLVLHDGKRTLTFLGTMVKLTPTGEEVSDDGRR